MDEARIRAAFAGVRNAYETHRPVLCEAVLRVPGVILELGAGDGSTPALHEVALASERFVITLESDRGWFDRFAHFHSSRHAVVYVPNWDILNGSLIQALRFGVAFVDHAADRRVPEILWLANRADVIVVHDTECDAYGYERLNGLFRWTITYQDQTPWTTVMSNFIDVSTWSFSS